MTPQPGTTTPVAQYTMRVVDPQASFPAQVRLDILTQIIPRATVQEVLASLGRHTPRVRKLSLELTLWLLLAASLFPDRSLEACFAQVVQGLHDLWPDDAAYPHLLPSAAALVYRRRQLGVRPLQALVRAVCRPRATPQTAHAFLGDFRLMALDGHRQDVPDTPANARAFGRPGGPRGDSAFPQVLCVSLVECGTHLPVDTTFWPCNTGEPKGAHRLLRSVTPEMVVLADRGFYSYAFFQALRARGAQGLVRLPKNIKPERQRRLPDGSWLVRVYPPGKSRRTYLELRLIEYTGTDPEAPGYGEHYRLLTSLLEEGRYPALLLACTYIQRWEIEGTVDEQDTHLMRQCHPSSPLRSRTPVGVLQELYGLVLMHYTVRAHMYEAATAAQVAPQRVSFTRAVQLVQDALANLERLVEAEVGRALQRLYRTLVHHLLPKRRLRRAPRAARRNQSKWPRKSDTAPLPQPKRSFSAALAII